MSKNSRNCSCWVKNCCTSAVCCVVQLLSEKLLYNCSVLCCAVVEWKIVVQLECAVLCSFWVKNCCTTAVCCVLQLLSEKLLQDCSVLCCAVVEWKIVAQLQCALLCTLHQFLNSLCINFIDNQLRLVSYLHQIHQIRNKNIGATRVVFRGGGKNYFVV